MAKYIDCDAFKAKYLCCGYLPEMSEEDFDRFPTADVAPVVRCESCCYATWAAWAARMAVLAAADDNKIIHIYSSHLLKTVTGFFWWLFFIFSAKSYIPHSINS